MRNTHHNRKLSRRDFFKLAVVGSVTAAGGYVLSEYAPWLGQIFVSGAKPEQQADADAKKLRSSPAAVVIASASEDRTSWVRTGQVYERLALKTTSLNVKSAFLNQPIEVADVRRQFQSALGLGTFMPQLLVRLGYAEAMPRSLRRPVKEVLI